MKKEHLGLLKSLEEIFAGFIDTFNCHYNNIKDDSDNLPLSGYALRSFIPKVVLTNLQKQTYLMLNEELSEFLR